MFYFSLSSDITLRYPISSMTTVVSSANKIENTNFGHSQKVAHGYYSMNNRDHPHLHTF